MNRAPLVRTVCEVGCQVRSKVVEILCYLHYSNAKDLRQLGQLIAEVPHLQDVEILVLYLHYSNAEDLRQADCGTSPRCGNSVTCPIKGWQLFCDGDCGGEHNGNESGARTCQILGGILHNRDTIVELVLPAFLDDGLVVTVCESRAPFC